MGHIPKDARWYLAEIVEEIVVQGDPRNLVHVNTTLVRADSPNEAYDRAQELGLDGEASYENSNGKKVVVRFRGLRSLVVVHDQLEHGAELAYSERIGVSDEEIARLIAAKEQLGVFLPITPSKAPDYGSREVREEALRRLRRANDLK